MRKKLLIAIIVIPIILIVWVIWGFISGMSELAPNGTLPIKTYSYPVKYERLLNATWTAISNNPRMSRAKPEPGYDGTDYYNDSVRYITCLYQKDSNTQYKFVFHFYGDSAYQAESKESEIGLKYVSSNKPGNMTGGEEDAIIAVFEKEFIVKIDSLIAGKPLKH